ncbi:MAG: polysaccharide biosynthesis C-terminal domain-containing protein [Oscillospiraceae bacterium]|nr:polysaccharide biosynthesis C-terminal domain-containing protein [Oscillospiraceae bacterium]
MITLMLMEVNYKIAIIMLEWFSVPNKDIGVYSLGIMLAQKLWIIPDALKDVLTSKLSKGKSVEEVSRITRISLWAVTACVAVVLTIGRPMIPLIFGQEYSGAYAVFLSIMVGIIGMVFYKMIYAYNVVNGRRKNNFICLCLTCITSVVLNCFTIPQYGILGAGVATTISYTLCGICFLVDFCKITGSRPATLLLIQKEDLQLLKKILRR